ncbi:MAG: NAD(P)H-hydrate dehydratase [Fidelibacterota bacterium]
MRLLTQNQARQLDRLAMEEEKIPGVDLMYRAGLAVAEEIKKLLTQTCSQDPVCIVCGKGNNGGDGFAAATFLQEWTIPVMVYAIPAYGQIKGDAEVFHQKCLVAGISIHYEESPPFLEPWSVILDAMLGTGVRGELREPTTDWVRWMNESPCPVVAADVPTGLHTDSGLVASETVSAAVTVTMGYPKLGLRLYPGAGYCGRIVTADIGFPDAGDRLDGLYYTEIEARDIDPLLPIPERTVHKYKMGRILIITGSRGMTGAAILAAQAAIRSGGGLVKICIPASLNTIIETNVIEGITIPCDDQDRGILSLDNKAKILDSIDWCDVVLVGPGLGRDPSTLDLVADIVQIINKPLILDADGLAVLQNHITFADLKPDTIITPHYGEWSGIIQVPVAEFRPELNHYLEQFLTSFKGVLHLKNAPSLTAQGERVVLNTTGYQGLASGGTGDVLAGIMVALRGQGLSAFDAARTAAYVHGACADRLKKEKGIRGLIASDIVATIPTVLTEYEQQEH